MPESAADIKATMDAIGDYLDRLYFTATFHGKTVAMLAEEPGFPIWHKNLSQGTNHGLGQYMNNLGKDPHSYISGQSGAPGWLGSASESATSKSHWLGIEDRRPGDADYDEPGGIATRTYTTTDIQYKFEKRDVGNEGVDNLTLCFGADAVMTNVNGQPGGTTVTTTKTVSGNNFYRSLDYPPRHSFALGRMFYGARGDATKRVYFEDAETETSFLKDVYHVFYGSITDSFAEYYMFDPNTWKETQITMNGDGTTAVPNGLDSGGAYFYPHESKVRLGLLGVPMFGMWLAAFSTVMWGRMLLAIHYLRKYRDPNRVIPLLGSLSKTVRQLADDAHGQWIANVGMPGASDILAATPWTDKGAGFVTTVYAVFMTLLGYGCGIAKYQAYADDAITVLRKAAWGVSPNNNNQKGYVESGGGKVEWTRPDHTGGVLVAWKRDSSDGKFYFATGYSASQLTIGALVEQRIITGIYQTKQDDDTTIPTNMEASALTWLAMRLYLACKYNDDYPDGTWANGLNLLSGFISGKVVKDGDSTPISGADVVLVKGNQTANPQSLTSYVARATTDVDGYYSLPFDSNGQHTVYVVKSGYKHMRKNYNIGAPDQNLAFPEARMVTV